MGSSERGPSATVLSGSVKGEITALNWSHTALGEPGGWPSSLKTSAEIIFAAPFPMCIVWGKDYDVLFNQSYCDLLNSAGLLCDIGMTAARMFEGIWPAVTSRFDTFFNGVPEASDFSVSTRNGGILKFSLGKIALDSGQTGGILLTASQSETAVGNEISYCKEQYEFAVNAAELGAWDLNPVTNLFTANDRFCTWHNLPKGQPIPVLEAFPLVVERDRARVLEAINRALDYRSGGNYDITYAISDDRIPGGERAVRAKGKAYFTPEKRAYRFTGTLEDITEDVLMRRALTESEQRFRTIADTAPCLIWMSGPDRACYFFNKGWLDFTGKSMDRAIGDGWAEGVHPDDLERCLDTYARHFETRTEFYREYRLKHHSGVYRWISDRGVPHLDYEGTFMGYIGGCMDIDEQKNFAIALEQEVKNRTRQLRESAIQLAATNAKLFDKNRDLELRILNEFSESFSAYKTGTAFFNSLTQDLAFKTKMNYVILGEVCAGTGDLFDIKCISVSAFGEISSCFSYPLVKGPCVEVLEGKLACFPRHCKSDFSENEAVVSLKIEGYIGYPLLDADRNPIGLVAVMHQREIKEVDYIVSLLKIAAKRAELELVRIRNEKQMAAQNVELQRQNAELDSFNYIASHDLQEPLRKIQTFISIILDTESSKFSPSGKGFLSRINASAQRMQNLIADLLSYSQASNADLNFVKTDLNKLMEDVISNLSVAAQRKKPVIAYRDLPTLPLLSNQVNQLFSNLLENSIKYGRKDVEPRIRIFARMVKGSELPDPESTRSEMDFWKISVADNGIGFEQQYQHRIFELFQRLHAKSQYEGTGIGLAICKKIVNRHNGYIFAKGEPGQGATFDIYFPV